MTEEGRSMFDLFSTVAQVSLTLDKATYLPGETVQATVDVQSAKDVAIQEGHAELFWVNHYMVTTQAQPHMMTAGPSGAMIPVSSPPESRQQADEVVVATQPF